MGFIDHITHSSEFYPLTCQCRRGRSRQ